MADCQPGSPPKVHEGGNYAQPTATACALPDGNPLERALAWSGRQNCASPHGGNPELEDIYKKFEGPPGRNLGHFEKNQLMEQRFCFYESLLDE